MTITEPRHQRRLHRAFITSLVVATALFAGAALMLWAWNLIAVDLAALPRLQFRHALAAEAAFAALVALTALIWRRLGAQPA